MTGTLIQTANGYLLCARHAEAWQRGGNDVSMWAANDYEITEHGAVCADCADNKGETVTGPFNEHKLRAELVATWGELSAHVELFDEILRRSECKCYPDLRDHEPTCPRRKSWSVQATQPKGNR